jgi:NTP pyrophosphatase (non-canonical NTP hydrolase)
MQLSDYQTAALRTLNQALSDDEQLVDAAAGLAEEAGEVLGLVRKHRFQGRPLDRVAAAEELGDVLWCLAALSARLGLSLDDVARANLEKLRRRHPDGLHAPPAGRQGPEEDQLH